MVNPAAVGLSRLPKVVQGTAAVFVCLKDPTGYWPRGHGLGKMQFDRSLFQAVLPTDSLWAVCDRRGIQRLVRVEGVVSSDPLNDYPAPQHIVRVTLADFDLGRQST